MRFSVWLRLLVALIGALVLAGAAPVLASPARQPIGVEAFWQQVDDALATLNGLDGQPEAQVVATLDRLVKDWENLDSVTLADGSSLPLDTSFILTELRRRPYNLDVLQKIFSALQKAAWQDPSRAFDQTHLAPLQEILQRPEFQWQEAPSPFQDLFNRFWAKLNEWLNRIFGNNEVVIPIPGDLLTIIASVLLAVVLVYVFRNLFGDLLLEATLKDENLASDENLTSETALQKAREISRTGDYRTAVRYLYLSSLLLLDERGLLRYDRSKTNREYLRSVAGFPHLFAPLREVIDVFDRVWYGFRSLGEEEFHSYAEKVEQLREQKK